MHTIVQAVIKKLNFKRGLCVENSIKLSLLFSEKSSIWMQIALRSLKDLSKILCTLENQINCFTMFIFALIYELIQPAIISKLIAFNLIFRD